MSDEALPDSEIMLYQTEDGRSRIQCRLEDETLWLTQVKMAELFESTPQNESLHLKAIFADGELVESAICKDYLQVRLEGGREVARKLQLDAVLAVGFACAAIEALSSASGPSAGSRSWAMRYGTAPRSHPEIPPHELRRCARSAGGVMVQGILQLNAAPLRSLPERTGVERD